MSPVRIAQKKSMKPSQNSNSIGMKAIEKTNTTSIDVLSESSQESITNSSTSITVSSLTARHPPQPHVYLTGYEEFKAYTMELKKDNKNYEFYFSGTKNNEGRSWCSDCLSAEPIVNRAVRQYVDKNDNSIFIHVDVGDRPAWKDMNNSFRTDKNIHLTVIPTLLRWKAPQRLEGNQLLNWELLELYFTDE